MVKGNWFEKLRNGVVVVDDEEGGVKTVARGNVVGGNIFKGNELDAFVNSTGRNVVRGNYGSKRSSPSGLCKIWGGSGGYV